MYINAGKYLYFLNLLVNLLKHSKYISCRYDGCACREHFVRPRKAKYERHSGEIILL